MSDRPFENRPDAAVDKVRHHQTSDRHILLPAREAFETAGDRLEIARRPREPDRTASGAEPETGHPDIDQRTQHAQTRLAREHDAVPEDACIAAALEQTDRLRRRRFRPVFEHLALEAGTVSVHPARSPPARGAITPRMRCRWMAGSPPRRCMSWQPCRRSSQAIVAMSRASTGRPSSRSVPISPLRQKAQRIVQEVEKILPEPRRPRNTGSSPRWGKARATRLSAAGCKDDPNPPLRASPPVGRAAARDGRRPRPVDRRHPLQRREGSPIASLARTRASSAARSSASRGPSKAPARMSRARRRRSASSDGSPASES